MTMKKDIRTLAALLMAGAAFTACSDKDEMIGEQTVNPVTKYTMTVNATKGDDGTTRALDLSGKTLNVKWAATDEVSVFPEAWSRTAYGTLTAAASATGSTTLTGEVTGASVNDKLNLLFPRSEWSYTGQKGILLTGENSIEKKYDYALAPVTVNSVSGNAITTTTANFTSQQAIVKFNIKNKATDAALNVTSLTISVASNKLVKGMGICKSTTHTGYTYDNGSGGFDAPSGLVDGSTGSKWCAGGEHKSNNVWYCEFHTASAVQVDGYTLTTGNDNSTCTGRNPKDWVLKAKVNSGDAWTTIANVANESTMEDINFKPYDFIVDNPGTYQYFRIEISNARVGGTMQLSELQLWAGSYGTSYGDLTVTPASAASELTVALRNEKTGTDTYNLTATVGEDIYSFEKSDVTFENGKYYNITVKMERQTTIDLSAVTTDITIPDGFTLTGTLDGAHKISIADGATVTLDNVTINGVHSDAIQYAGITCLGDAIIILKDGTTNTVNGNDGAYPGIQAGGADKTLTITGSGSLDAHSNGTGAGIGSAKNKTCGNIVISGGTITATSGYYGAGIGSGYLGGCGTITISSGTITATGGSYAAGIGSGYNNANCGNITITSTVTHVTATKGKEAPNSIGAGKNGNCGTVSIEDPSKVTQN